MIDLVEYCRRFCTECAVLPRKERWSHAQAWRETFCGAVFQRYGKWVRGSYAWEAFSSGYVDCLHGERALQAYLETDFTDILIIPEIDAHPALRCTAPAPIDFGPLRLDLFVGPSSWEWTMIFTHEFQSYGPYFARA